MAYLPRKQLEQIGFKSLGKNVLISDKASIYDPEKIEIGDHVRIDDFCVVSGKVKIGRNVQLAVFCNVAGGEKGVIFEDFTCLAYGCHVITQSDDYEGHALTNSTIPREFRKEKKKAVVIGRHSIVGTNSVIFPGVTLAEGTSVGALSLVAQSTREWSVYFGNPAKRVMERKRDLLQLEKEYLLSEEKNKKKVPCPD